MGRVNTPTLTLEQRRELEFGVRDGKSHSFRKRCQSILLKSKGRTSRDVGKITSMCNVSVDTWVKRYKAEGLHGLITKFGRGRKPIIEEHDKEAVLSAIKANRQRMQTAKAEWERASGKKVCNNTFKSFLKSLADDISV
jgi:transposase